MSLGDQGAVVMVIHSLDDLSLLMAILRHGEAILFSTKSS